MKTFKNSARQGDLLICRIDSFPGGLTAASAVNGQYVLAHSETGHNHVVLERGAQMLIDQTKEFIAYLEISEPSEITHLRDFETHEPIRIEPGKYEIRRQREYMPEGFRRAQD